MSNIVDTFDEDCKHLKSKFNLYNDLWTAKQFIDQYTGQLRWCSSLGGWFAWTGKRWRRDDINNTQRLLIDKVNDLHKVALRAKDEFLLKHVKATGQSTRLNSILKLLSSHPSIVTLPENFDCYPNKLNCSNGILDVDTNVFTPHSSSLYITKLAQVRYDPKATCPIWEQFLETIFQGKTELIQFVQRMIGYALIDYNPEQVFFILYGGGQNGKSTFLQAVRRLLGNYTMHAKISTFMSKGNNVGPSNDLARLRGSRLVTAAESAQNQTLDESLIKEITGGEPLTARFLHKEFFEFLPTFKVFMITNHKPNISGTDEGIWRRVMLIPFNYTIPKENRIHKYEEKLFNELPGILNWALQGYQSWKKMQLDPPLDVLDAINDYRDEEDLFSEFIGECCEVGVMHLCRTINMKKTFQMWCKENNLRFLRHKRLMEYLTQHNYAKIKQTSGMYRAQWCWEGIMVKDTYAEVPDNTWQEKQPF